MRDAPPPCCIGSDGRGAQRAPLAEPGTTPAMEASALRFPLEAERDDSTTRSDGLPHSARSPKGEHGIWGRQEARSPEGASTGRWGHPIPPSPQLPPRGVRRGHPSVLAAFGRCAPPTSPCTIVQSRARPSGCATRFVTPEGVRMGEVVDHQLSLSRFEEW